VRDRGLRKGGWWVGSLVLRDMSGIIVGLGALSG